MFSTTPAASTISDGEVLEAKNILNAFLGHITIAIKSKTKEEGSICWYDGLSCKLNS